MPGLFIVFEDGEKVEVPHEVDVEGGAAIEHWVAAEAARRAAAQKPPRRPGPTRGDEA